MADNEVFYPIGVVERDTGIGRDTLRIWERRYGFPTPRRNERGERIYDERQLRRLQRIRRLLDQGLRPGKLVGLDEPALASMEADFRNEADEIDPAIAVMLEAARTDNAWQLEELLAQRYQAQGLRQFILQTMAPLLHGVGEQWAAGHLQVYQEHFISAQLLGFTNTLIARLPEPSTSTAPVLLATLPGEQHTLGLLMVSALLIEQGISTINLGAEMPMDQLVQAVSQFHARTVGLSFSAAYNYRQIRPDVLELRQQLAPDVAIWLGGEAVQAMRKLPEGVSRFKSLEQLVKVSQEAQRELSTPSRSSIRSRC